MIAITGGTGHSGGFLVDWLSENNFKDKIRFLVRENSNTSKIEASGLNYEICKAALDDVSALVPLFEGADTILHIASIRLSPYIVSAAVQGGYDG